MHILILYKFAACFIYNTAWLSNLVHYSKFDQLTLLFYLNNVASSSPVATSETSFLQ